MMTMMMMMNNDDDVDDDENDDENLTFRSPKGQKERSAKRKRSPLGPVIKLFASIYNEVIISIIRILYFCGKVLISLLHLFVVLFHFLKQSNFLSGISIACTFPVEIHNGEFVN